MCFQPCNDTVWAHAHSSPQTEHQVRAVQIRRGTGRWLQRASNVQHQITVGVKTFFTIGTAMQMPLPRATHLELGDTASLGFSSQLGRLGVREGERETDDRLGGS